MAGHYLFNFTRSGTAKRRSMREQAAELLIERTGRPGDEQHRDGSALM